MFTLSNLPDAIPVFPLPRVILLPGYRIPLNIFEPRYLAMLDDALKTQHRLVGIIQPRSEREDETELQSVGCAGRIIEFSETSDGRYLISLKGIIRFRVLEVISGFAPYLRARMGWDEFEDDFKPASRMKGLDRNQFLKLQRDYFEAKGLADQWEQLKSSSCERLVNLLSIICDFDIEEKQALLESSTLDGRREVLESLVTFALHSGSRGNTIQ